MTLSPQNKALSERVLGFSGPRTYSAAEVNELVNAARLEALQPSPAPVEWREAAARIIAPVDWEAHDLMSPEEFRFSGLSVEHSLAKADQIAGIGVSQSQPNGAPAFGAATEGQGDLEWVAYFGGGRPVDEAVTVDIRLAGPCYQGDPRCEFFDERAGDWDWDHETSDPRIIAWRHADPAEPAAAVAVAEPSEATCADGLVRDEQNPKPPHLEGREG